LNQKYFDCHFHIIDKSFPVVPNQGFMPDAFTSENYLDRLKAVDLCGGAVVSGSFQAFDQSYLFHALKVLGPSFVGVTQVPQAVSDQELKELNSAGVRAVRFNVKRGGFMNWSAGTPSYISTPPSLPTLLKRWCRYQQSASTISVSPKQVSRGCSNSPKKARG
jgi:predicted TIM-barrel fold metal-dependent hydrolase